MGPPQSASRFQARKSSQLAGITRHAPAYRLISLQLPLTLFAPNSSTPSNRSGSEGASTSKDHFYFASLGPFSSPVSSLSFRAISKPPRRKRWAGFGNPTLMPPRMLCLKRSSESFLPSPRPRRPRVRPTMPIARSRSSGRCCRTRSTTISPTHHPADNPPHQVPPPQLPLPPPGFPGSPPPQPPIRYPTPSIPVAIPPRERSAASLALSEETYPTTLSCRDAFDYAWRCHTAGAKLNGVYPVRWVADVQRVLGRLLVLHADAPLPARGQGGGHPRALPRKGGDQVRRGAAQQRGCLGEPRPQGRAGLRLQREVRPSPPWTTPSCRGRSWRGGGRPERRTVIRIRSDGRRSSDREERIDSRSLQEPLLIPHRLSCILFGF